MNHVFTSGDMLKLTGATYRQLDTWVHDGVLDATARGTDGRGSIRIFGLREALAGRVIVNLRQAGVSLQAVRKVAEHLMAMEFESNIEALAGTWILTDGVNVYERRGEAVFDVLHRQGQGVLFVVDLGSVAIEVRRIAANLRKMAA